jgi:hypothetical protein
MKSITVLKARRGAADPAEMAGEDKAEQLPSDRIAILFPDDVES